LSVTPTTSQPARQFGLRKNWPRSWFEARGYYFKGLSTYDWQKQQPIVAPVIDYDKRRP
jgi:hypothetical protein